MRPIEVLAAIVGLLSYLILFGGLVLILGWYMHWSVR
jgi:hypothetical protein